MSTSCCGDTFNRFSAIWLLTLSYLRFLKPSYLPSHLINPRLCKEMKDSNTKILTFKQRIDKEITRLAQ